LVFPGLACGALLEGIRSTTPFTLDTTEMARWSIHRKHPSLTKTTSSSPPPPSSIRQATTDRDISLGHQNFEIVTIDCRYLSDESRWGLLRQKPAAVLFLRLGFKQPAGYPI